MNATESSWWSRLMRGLGRGRKTSVEPDGLTARANDDLVGDGSFGRAAFARTGVALQRWGRRDPAATDLHEGYRKVTALIEDMQRHMALQGERSDRICASLEQLARSLADLPELSSRQARTLASIAEQMESAASRGEQMAAALNEMPKAARLQAEALSGINRQLGIASEQEAVARQTLEKLSAAVGALSDFNAAQAEAMKQMATRTDEQNRQLNQLLARQTRRFTMLFAVTVALATLAVAAVAAGLLTRSAASG